VKVTQRFEVRFRLSVHGFSLKDFRAALAVARESEMGSRSTANALRHGFIRTFKHPILSASAETSPVAATAAAALALLEAGLAIHGTIPARFERYSGLLSAPGANHGSTARLTALVSSTTTGLLLLLGLTARLATLWC